jgi:hypothetical protein
LQPDSEQTRQLLTEELQLGQLNPLRYFPTSQDRHPFRLQVRHPLPEHDRQLWEAMLELRKYPTPQLEQTVREEQSEQFSLHLRHQLELR